MAYGQSELQTSPYVSAARQSSGPIRGDQVIVTVANASGPLTIRTSLGFEVLATKERRNPSSSHGQLWDPPDDTPMWYSAPILRAGDGGGTHTVTLSLANIQGAPSVQAVRYLWGNTPCSGQIFSCPIYVTVPQLGGNLSGENDTLPLGPAIVACH